MDRCYDRLHCTTINHPQKGFVSPILDQGLAQTCQDSFRREGESNTTKALLCAYFGWNRWQGYVVQICRNHTHPCVRIPRFTSATEGFLSESHHTAVAMTKLNRLERTWRNLLTSTRVGQSSGTSLVAAANVQPAVLFVTWLFVGCGRWKRVDD